MIVNRLLIGQYYALDSLAHRLDARAKLLAVLIYMIALFTAQQWISYLLLAAIFFLALIISRIPFLFLWRGMWMIILFIVISMFFNFFMVPGEVIASFGIFQLTEEGLTKGLLIGSRLLLLVLFASLLTLCTTPLDLTDGMERLLSPLIRLGAPIHELAMIISIALRFIPTILQEFDRIILAQRARGARFSGLGLIKKAQQMMPLLIPLFISSFRRAEDLAWAMEARCYRGGRGRSRWRQSQWKPRDTVTLLIFVFILLLVIYLRVKGL
ncbi:MAG: energy-coupling factor transporter transmembrane component T family protein [Bacillota bacterium]